MLPPLADVFDLADLVDGDMDDPQFVAQATLTLQLASGAVRGYTRQRLDLVVADEVTVWTRGPIALLPELPARDVTVTIDGEEFTAWRLEAGGVLRRTDRRVWPATIEVVYTHGHEPIPDDIRSVVLATAVRRQGNPQGLRSEQIDDYRYQVGDTGAGGELTPAEQATLGHYRAML